MSPGINCFGTSEAVGAKGDGVSFIYSGSKRFLYDQVIDIALCYLKSISISRRRGSDAERK
jgi:hypothetical protein